MAENTRLKELTSNVQNLPSDVKWLHDMMESCHTEYSNSFDRMEVTITTLSVVGDHQDSPKSTNVNFVAPPFQVRNIKLDFPLFNGSNVLEWIFKAEIFFTYYNTPDAQCHIIVVVHMNLDRVVKIDNLTWLDPPRVNHLVSQPNLTHLLASQKNLNSPRLTIGW